MHLPEDMVFAGDMDATLLRFIRARKLNIDDTFAMITGDYRLQLSRAGMRGMTATVPWHGEH